MSGAGQNQDTKRTLLFARESMAEKEKDSADWMDAAVAFIEHMNQRDDLFDAVAAANKKQFDALVRAGFREDHAALIVAGMASKPDK